MDRVYNITTPAYGNGYIGKAWAKKEGAYKGRVLICQTGQTYPTKYAATAAVKVMAASVLGVGLEDALRWTRTVLRAINKLHLKVL